jgi:hypothetical protein
VVVSVVAHLDQVVRAVVLAAAEDRPLSLKGET